MHQIRVPIQDVRPGDVLHHLERHGAPITATYLPHNVVTAAAGDGSRHRLTIVCGELETIVEARTTTGPVTAVLRQRDRYPDIVLSPRESRLLDDLLRD